MIRKLDYFDEKGNMLSSLTFRDEYADVDTVDKALFKTMCGLFPVDNSAEDDDYALGESSQQQIPVKKEVTVRMPAMIYSGEVVMELTPDAVYQNDVPREIYRAASRTVDQKDTQRLIISELPTLLRSEDPRDSIMVIIPVKYYVYNDGDMTILEEFTRKLIELKFVKKVTAGLIPYTRDKHADDMLIELPNEADNDGVPKQ